MGQKQNTFKNGFTIVEIIVVILIIGILAALVYGSLNHPSQKVYRARTITEARVMENALKLYVAKTNEYPSDVSRNIPAAIKDFVSSDNDPNADKWPSAPYPGSVYDYENWPPQTDPVTGADLDQTYQISVRLCQTGEDTICRDNAKKYLADYVPAATLNNWDSLSAIFYCFSGSCRSHQSKTMSYPGYCLNCQKQPWEL